MLDDDREYVIRSKELSELFEKVRLKDLGLISLPKRAILDSPHTDDLFMKTLVAMTMKEQHYSVPGLVVRTFEPYLDLKKGLGTKRHILPEKWDGPLPNVPENEPERFLGDDLRSNEWKQEYWTYDDEQAYKGEISVYTTNHFIENKEFNPEKDRYEHMTKKLDNAPIKSYMITGIQIMSDDKPTADFIKIQKKYMKTIDMVSTETIWAQPNKFYEFRTPIIFNPDIEIVFGFTPDKSFENYISVRKDNIMIHGWVCEPLGKTMMG
jgi:hypothetical protein